MAGPPFIPFYWGDYWKDTAHLRGVVEHGAYMLLLFNMWDRGGKLPNDPALLAGLAQCTPDEWVRAWAKLSRFFQIRRGFLHQKRVSRELAKYKSTSCKRKEAGRMGGLAKGRKHTGNPEANAKPDQANQNQKENQKEVKNTPPTFATLTPPSPGGAAGLLPDDAADAPVVPKKTPPTPAIFLPDDWAPDDALVAFGVAKGLTPMEIFDEADEFRDHWRARRDSRARKADWPATFRNRLRKVVGDRLARPIAAPAAPNARRANTDNFRNAWARRLEAPDDAEAARDGPRADRRDDAGRQGVLRLPGPGDP